MKKHLLPFAVGILVFALYRLISAAPLLTVVSIRKSTNNVHIALAFDGADYSIGTKASIFSTLKNAADPSLVTIHLFHFPSDRELCQQEFDFVNRLNGTLKLHEYVPSDVKPYINEHLLYERLKFPGNYVRFLLEDRLSDVDRCLWMDSDTIVSGDVIKFFSSAPDFPTKAIATFPRKWNALEPSIWKQFSRNGVKVSNARSPSFNAGIMVFNLDYWRLHNVTGKIQQLVQINQREKIVTAYGSQWPLQILFSGKDFQKLDRRLYVDFLGTSEDVKSQRIKRALFLHWNGDHKPWLEDGYNKWAWEDYRLPARLQE